MTDYMVINSTDAEVTNINAGGVDVPARSVGYTITLTAAELATAVATAGVAVILDTSTYQHRRNLARTLKYRKAAVL